MIRTASDLATAISMNEFEIGERNLSELLTEPEQEALAREIFRVMDEEPARLASMTWLTLKEACAYANMSPRKITELANDPKSPIYATKMGDGKTSSLIFKRESIDDHYYGRENKMVRRAVELVLESLPSHNKGDVERIRTLVKTALKEVA